MANDGSSVHEKAISAYEAVQSDSGSIATGALADSAVTPAKTAADGFGAPPTVVDHGDASETALLTAPTGVTLAGICAVKCTESIADGGGGAPTFSAGDGTTADAFVGTTEYASNGTSGDRFSFGFELSPGDSLTITPTDGTGGDAGKFEHTVVATRVTASA
jgi:hypothetical protein